MKNFKIRQIDKTEILELQKVGKAIFYDTYISKDTISQMDDYLENNFSLNQLLKELNNPESTFFFVEDDDKTIGFLKLNTGNAQTSNVELSSLEIERIYVISEYHGKKIGDLLLKKAISFAMENKLNYIWLGVWEKNFRAIRFYEKKGFVETERYYFSFGDERPINIKMELKLL